MARTATHQVNFRVTDDELAILKMNAERAGFTKVPVYCKRLALGVKIKPQVIGKELGQAMLPHIAHIGSNINQLARKANSEGISLAMAAQLETVQNQFNALWELVLEGKKPKKEDVIIPVEAQEQEKEEDDAHTCPMCGGVAIRRYSEKHGKDFWICPNYSKGQGHLFEWVE